MDAVYRLAAQSKADPTEYVLSDETVDRYGDVINADGWDLTNFKKHSPLLYNHNSSAVVGGWQNVRVEGKKLVGKLVLAAQGTSAVVDEVRRLWEQGFLKAVSVGFNPINKEPLTKDADPFWGPFRYLKQELVECSLVAVPANPNALQLSRGFELPTSARKQLFGELAGRTTAGTGLTGHGTLASRSLHAGGNTMSKISKRIEDAQKRINVLKDQLTALTDKDDPTEDDIALMEEIPEQIRENEVQLERDMRIETALAVKTIEHDPRDQQQVKDGQQPRRPFAVPAKKFTPRDLLIRGAAVQLMAHIHKRGVMDVTKELYGDDEATHWLMRAVTNPAMTTVPGWASELVETAIGEFLDLLPVDSIYAPLARLGGRFTFGRNGAIRVPARQATPTISGAFVGEGAPIPVRRLALTSITLTPKKMGVISTFTRELAAHSTPAIEGIIRQAMADDTAVTIDTTLLDDLAATTIRPAGLLNGVVALSPSATVGPQAMVEDIRALLTALTANRGGRSVAILINPAQNIGLNFQQTVNGEFMFASAAEAGNRLGVTFIVSANVPVGTVIAIDAADFVSATGDVPEYDVSDQATIHEESDAPLPINAAAAATPVRSLWQTASIGVRMLLDINWAMRRPGMVQYMEDVIW